MFYAFLGGIVLGAVGLYLLYSFYKMKKGVSLQADATTSPNKPNEPKS